jgi:hypothetical protein
MPLYKILHTFLIILVQIANQEYIIGVYKKTTEELLDVSFSMKLLSNRKKRGDYFFPELPVFSL